MLKILTIDTIHHPLSEEDMRDLRAEWDEADIVIHTFAPFAHQVLKGRAEVKDIRQRVRGNWEHVTRTGA